MSAAPSTLTHKCAQMSHASKKQKLACSQPAAEDNHLFWNNSGQHDHIRKIIRQHGPDSPQAKQFVSELVEEQRGSTTDGRDYVGKVNRDGQLHGQGKLTYPDGRVYEGNFQNGKYHGTGKLTLPDGYVQEGNFQNGELHGMGKDADYEGEWIDDDR